MDFKSGPQKLMSLVLRDSTEIAQKSILFITPDVLGDRHNVHIGSWSGAATFWLE